MEIMESQQLLISAIDEFRKSIIGIFIPTYNQIGIEFIIDIDEDLVKTISIGGWLGVVENNYPVNMGRIVMFEEGINFHSLLQNPYEFMDFLRENNFI